MQLITQIPDPASSPSDLPRIPLQAARWQLQKKRWRGEAADGQAFGFDLEQPLNHGTVFFQSDTAVYVIEQLSETVLYLPYPHEHHGQAHAAELGWQIGNLHFAAQFLAHGLQVESDPALIQLFERLHLPYEARQAILQLGVQAHRH